ncbi:hypothetical protein BGZ95_006716 [Linnemannia exigua]|uniref:Crinkler effector protein N-terminal domain-containing protein n=1 Tax=Linnemannia exigua TaxID=604196 RepID=A0AAD4D0S3_9FUNG|nr:hypothetical protein BGZ95_006716 [Linnemannia exigua]
METPTPQGSLSLFAVINGKKVNQAITIDIQMSRTISDLRDVIKVQFPLDLHYDDCKHLHNIPAGQMTLWRAVLPHPDHWPGLKGMGDETVTLDKCKTKVKLGLDELVCDVFTRENYSPKGGMMFVVFEFDI